MAIKRRFMTGFGITPCVSWQNTTSRSLQHGSPKRITRTEFVYLLEWPDKETMTDRWEKFLHDPEWIKIKKETGEMNGPLVGEIQDRILYLTDYSPRQVLAK